MVGRVGDLEFDDFLAVQSVYVQCAQSPICNLLISKFQNLSKTERNREKQSDKKKEMARKHKEYLRINLIEYKEKKQICVFLWTPC